MVHTFESYKESEIGVGSGCQMLDKVPSYQRFKRAITSVPIFRHFFMLISAKKTPLVKYERVSGDISSTPVCIGRRRWLASRGALCTAFIASHPVPMGGSIGVEVDGPDWPSPRAQFGVLRQ